MITTDFRIDIGQDKELPADQFNEAYKKTLESMGMTAAVERYFSKTEDANDSPIPYPRMDKMLSRWISILMDSESKLEAYKHDQPPMEALGLMFYAHQTAIFDEIIIKYHNTDPDPIAIGRSGQERFLICAWGPDTVDRDSIRSRAEAKLRKELPEQIRAAVRKFSSMATEDGIETLIERILAGEWVYENVTIGNYN